MVGVLAGDALLAPYETWSAADVQRDIKARGGLVPFEYANPWSKDKDNPNYFPPGRPTDDSDHTAALAESLIAQKGLKEEDLYPRLRSITFGHISPLWSGRALGAGKTTRKMLRPENYADSLLIPRDDDFPSNGSLMRAAPLALYFGSFDSVDPSIVERMSHITHRHEMACDCCGAYVGILANLLEGRDKAYAVKTHIGFSLADVICMNAESRPQDPEEWPGRGAAALTLHVALWALLTTNNFRDALTKIAGVGGDTDTYGAVAGGLLGAYYGLESIPEDWQQVLLGRDKMVMLADQLYDIAHS